MMAAPTQRRPAAPAFLLAALALVVMASSVAGMSKAASMRGLQQMASVQKNFSLPPLDYAFNALEPTVDNQTMYLHHDLHHAAFIRNLNAALKRAADSGMDLYGTSLSQLNTMIGTRKLAKKLPADLVTTLRNNGGGAWNHALFWRVMAPTGSSNRTRPSNSSALGAALIRDFGSVQAMVDKMSTAATSQFGSGWAWLLLQPKTGALSVVSTANQDNPLMPAVDKKAPLIPILGIDVWEHAYYLRYYNRRPDYVRAWFDAVNWNQVALNFEAAKKRDYDAIIGAVANLPK